jgi:NADPH-dependent glutamate synthase beta subunit-like oxidoreductase
MEVKGIPKTLAAHGIEFEELGLEGCTLFYRRGEEDMPLMEMPEDADEKRREKVRAGRKKMLAKAMEKYRFKFEPLCMPDDLIVEDGRLVGLRFRRTKMVDGRPQPTDETFERRGCYVISSIGSIPEPIEGIPMKGELFQFSDWHLGRLENRPTVFSAGNVVTGKGNIVASRKHAREITGTMIESFLGLAEDAGAAAQGLVEAAREHKREQAAAIAGQIEKQPPMPPGALEALRARVKERQQKVGYDGDYAAWIARFHR